MALIRFGSSLTATQAALLQYAGAQVMVSQGQVVAQIPYGDFALHGIIRSVCSRNKTPRQLVAEIDEKLGERSTRNRNVNAHTLPAFKLDTPGLLE